MKRRDRERKARRVKYDIKRREEKKRKTDQLAQYSTMSTIPAHIGFGSGYHSSFMIHHLLFFFILIFSPPSFTFGFYAHIRMNTGKDKPTMA